MNRRNFLKAGAASLALAALPRNVWAQTDPSLDVVIVGGGVTGCYAGWRLRTMGLNCLLLEGSDRIGGRLYSVVHPEAPDLYAEIGGMRFPKSHESVYGLAEHIGLKIRPFPMGTSANYAYVRDTHLTVADLGKKGKVPYKLHPSEQGMAPMDLLAAALIKTFPKALNMDAGPAMKYLQTMQLEGRPLHEWGFFNMLQSKLSTEAWHYIRDACGYYSVMSNSNAYDMLVQYAFYELPEPYFTLTHGYQSLPLKLAELYQGAGGQLAMSTRLVTVNRLPDGLEVVAKGPDGSVKKLKTKHVILALPRRSLELLDRTSLPFQSQQFIDAMEAVHPVHASKLFFWFEKEWWTKLGLKSGPSYTDLPVRGCFYFGTENRAGLLMTSYSDEEAADYWGSYYASTVAAQNAPGFSNRGNFADALRPSKAMVADALGQLEKLHRQKIVQPHSAIYRNWQVDPYGGGWHQWLPYAKSWEIIPFLRKPLPDANVYVCGEAYSNVQGWVRGSLDTTERLLAQQFAAPRPTWVSKGYDFGP